MEFELGRTSTRSQIKKSEMPSDMPSLAMSYIRQNNDLRHTLRRFEKEKLKQMKSIEGDIWELQRFMQELKCVTAISADDILKRQKISSKERPLDVTGKSQAALHTNNFQREDARLHSNEKIFLNPLSGSTNENQMERVKNSFSFTDLSRQQRERKGSFSGRVCERRRSYSVGEMRSDALNHLRTIAGYKPTLFSRRRSMDVGTIAAGKIPSECKTVNQPTHKNHIVPPPMKNDRVHAVSTGFLEPLSRSVIPAENGSNAVNFEHFKSSMSQRARMPSMPSSRRASPLEEAALYDVSQDNDNRSELDINCEKPNSLSSNVRNSTKNTVNHRLLTQRETEDKLFIKRLPPERQLKGSHSTNEVMVFMKSPPSCESPRKRRLERQATSYKETTSSLLRKKISMDTTISFLPKDRRKTLPQM